MGRLPTNGTRHWTAESWAKVRAARRRQRPPAEKHGAYTALTAVKSGKLDGRTALGKAAKRLQDELVADIGGWESVGAGKRILIDKVIVNSIFIHTVERYIFERGSVLDGDGEVCPALGKFYNAACNRMRLDLLALGLERRTREPKTIHDLLAEAGDKGPSVLMVKRRGIQGYGD